MGGEGLGCNYVFSYKKINLLREALITATNELWKNFNLREAISFSSDYDLDFDNNGNLTLRKNKLLIEGCIPKLLIINNRPD